MPSVSNILYLHGFASGPRSAKGCFFAEKFGELGLRVHQPDLAEGDFESLTLTKQLRLIDRLARELRPALLMGSSLGGYLAALYGSRYPELAPAIVLLAPAFGFPQRWAERLGEEKMLAWRRDGRMDVYHYGEAGMRPIGFQFYQDALWFDPFPDVRQPALILHGKQDEDVDPALSVRFAHDKPNVTLELLDSDHRLTDATEILWRETAAFYRAVSEQRRSAQPENKPNI